MPGTTKPATTRQRATLQAAAQGASPGPSSFDDDSILLNQQGLARSLEQDRETGTSHYSNPTFDPSTFVTAFQSIAKQQVDQQLANQQLFRLVASLADKVDDLGRRSIANDEENKGEEISAPCHIDEGEM